MEIFFLPCFGNDRVYEEDQMLNLDEKGGLLPSNKITTGFVELPVTLEANFVFHHGFSNRFNILSMSDIISGVINDRELMAMIEDKIIVIGSSAAGLNDLHATNLEQAVPGPIIMLSAIHQILSERFLEFSPEIDAVTTVILFCFLILLFLIAGKDRMILDCLCLFHCIYFLLVCKRQRIR